MNDAAPGVAETAISGTRVGGPEATRRAPRLASGSTDRHFSLSGSGNSACLPLPEMNTLVLTLFRKGSASQFVVFSLYESFDSRISDPRSTLDPLVSRHNKIVNEHETAPRLEVAFS